MSVRAQRCQSNYFSTTPCMFSFYKYAALILPSLERISYSNDPRADSDGWLSPGCSLCRRSSSSETGGMRPSRSVRVPMHGVRRPPNLKGAASDVPFRYVLNLEASRMDSRIPFDRVMYVATCGLDVGGATPLRTAQHYVCLLLQDDELRSYDPIQNVCIWIRLLASSDWLQEVVYDRARFIPHLLEEYTTYCAKCETLLFEIGTEAFIGCVRRKRNLLYRD